MIDYNINNSSNIYYHFEESIYTNVFLNQI